MKITTKIEFKDWIKQPRPNFMYPDAYHYYRHKKGNSLNYTLWWEGHEDDMRYGYNLKGKRNFTLLEIVEMGEEKNIASKKLQKDYEKGINDK